MIFQHTVLLFKIFIYSLEKRKTNEQVIKTIEIFQTTLAPLRIFLNVTNEKLLT